jgi:CubicO group peptidase (beta-lactamase class C family)
MANFKNLDNLLQSFVDRGLPGCGMQITQKGETIYENYFGYSDVATKAPITAKSLFRQASLSKIPLYTVAMMLYERGKFLMTDPIDEYLPEWKNLTKFVKDPNGHVRKVPTNGPITVRDCLSMKCGLPYCNTQAPSNDRTLTSMQKCMEPLWAKGHFTLQEHLAAMSKATLAFEPGEHWIYGFSSELTAGLIEVVCGKPIDDVFQEMLFDPLGMNDTRSRFFGDAEQRLVKLYRKTPEGELKDDAPKMFDDKHIPGPEHEAGWARLFATVNDYSKLCVMLSNGGEFKGRQIMGRKTIDMMRANGLNEIQQKDFDNLYLNGYGYGYGVRTLIDKQKGNHNGSLGAFCWTGGFGTWCEADPEEGVGIVYMHNQMPNEEEYYHLRMRAAAYGCIR